MTHTPLTDQQPTHRYGLSVLSIIAVSLDPMPMDCEDTDTAHVWVRVPGWTPRRAFLTGAAPFAKAAGCEPAELAGRRFFARLDLNTVPGNDDTAGERLEWPELQECPPLPAEWLAGRSEEEPAVGEQPPAEPSVQLTRTRALALLEAATFLQSAHFQDGLSVQEIGTALRHTADEADPMVGSLARDGFGLDEIAEMLSRPAAAVQPAAESCGKCRTQFDPADTRFDGAARYGVTSFCGRCVDACHESTDAFHECVICR